jgi:hypothetical protein
MQELTTVGVSRDEAISAAKEDLNFFGALCLPDVFVYLFPPVFLAIWQLLTDGAKKQQGQDKLAIGLPRGFGKTILLKLYVVWLVLFSDRRFILVVCNTAALAENFVADVVDILDSPNIKRLFGDWRIGLEKDTQPLKKFAFAGRPVILAALGSGSSLRGLNIKFVRPDCIIMDDMQSREEAESHIEAAKTLTWMLGTLLKANNKTRCQFIFVGNMYPFDGSILKKLRSNPAWYSFICGAILADGQSIWPELRSVEDIMDELENDTSMGHPEIFYSEVMNDDEAGNKAGIDITKINVFKEDEFDGLPQEPEAGFVLIDPSAGKRKGDSVAIGAVLIFDGKPVLREVAVDAFNPAQQVDMCLKLCLKYGLTAILVESVAYQATLAFWIHQAKERHGMHAVQVHEIYPGTNTKNSRIINALKLLTSDGGHLSVHQEVYARIVHQITHWNPLRTKNVDDLLDILAYIYPAIQEFGLALQRPLSSGAVEQVLAAFASDLSVAF